MAASKLFRRSSLLSDIIPLRGGQRTLLRELSVCPILCSNEWQGMPRCSSHSAPLFAGRLRPIARHSPYCAFMSTGSKRSQTSVDSSKENSENYEHGSVLMQFAEKDDEPKQLSTAKKVVEAGKDAGYMGMIAVGLGIAGCLIWAVMSEFFSSNSPQKLFSKALRAIKNNEQARSILGDPIAGYGDTTGRGRRRHISSQQYVVNGEDYMRVVFFVSGSKRKGTAHMDLKKNEDGKYICRYLVIEVNNSPAVITIEDNR